MGTEPTMQEIDLSLFGFLEQAEAETYLGRHCTLDDGDDPTKLWHAATERLGKPIPRAGRPEMTEMPKGNKGYLNRLQKQDRFKDTVKGLDDWSFMCVEIAPLLAFQIHIEGARSQSLGSDLPEQCTTKHLVTKCLPEHPEPIRPVGGEKAEDPSSGSYYLEAPTRNFLYLATGAYELSVQDRYVVGALVGVASPFVQVIRFEKRCYLTNGYHRILSASKRGATHVPCIVGDTKNFARTGAEQDGSLPRHLFDGDNPPTVGHYTQHRAAAVCLRRFATRVDVTWKVSYPPIGASA